MNKKPRGYWTDIDNIESELLSFMKIHPELNGTYPSRKFFYEHGAQMIYRSINRYHRSFRKFQEKIIAKDFTVREKPKISHPLENIEDLETALNKIYAKYPHLHRDIPSQEWLLKQNRFDIIYAIQKIHGGRIAVRRKLKLNKGSFEKGYLEDFDNFKREFIKIYDKHPDMKGTFPSQRWLKNNNYGNLLIAMYRYYGGMQEVSKRLQIGKVNQSKLQYASWEDVLSEIKLIQKEYPQFTGTIPPSSWLKENGYTSLYNTIRKRFGGKKSVFERLAKTRKKNLESLLTKYVNT